MLPPLLIPPLLLLLLLLAQPRTVRRAALAGCDANSLDYIYPVTRVSVDRRRRVTVKLVPLCYHFSAVAYAVGNRSRGQTGYWTWSACRSKSSLSTR